jgi:hypothetical protein
VAGTLSGAAVSASALLILRRSQSKHEQIIKLHDDRRAAYGKLAFLAPELCNVLMDIDAGDPDSEYTTEEALKPLTQEIRLAFAQIRLLGSRKVVLAAQELLDAVLDPPRSRERLTAAELHFEKAAREDLRVG